MDSQPKTVGLKMEKIYELKLKASEVTYISVLIEGGKLADGFELYASIKSQVLEQNKIEQEKAIEQVLESKKADDKKEPVKPVKK